MAVQYINGQYYNNPFSNDIFQNAVWLSNVKNGRISPIAAPTNGNNGLNGANVSNSNGNNTFYNASSGGIAGTLQPFVNRNTSLANNALYGGLLGYQPQQLMAGNAGGTPVSPQPPQWRLPSAIPTPNQGQVGLLGNLSNIPAQGIFSKRSWMGA